MSLSHKRQHWIPKSDLSAWLDPGVPFDQTPYVHVFSRDGQEGKRKPPEMIFRENNIYTIKRADGVRDLRLEHGLASLEAAFGVIRKDFLETRKSKLPIVRRAKLSAFVAAMHARTPHMRDHHMKFWNEVLGKGESVERHMKTATVEEKRRAASIPSLAHNRKSMSLDDVRKIVSSPMENTLVPILQAEAPLLVKMRFVVLNTEGAGKFITSDNPVVWYDPDGYKRPPLFRSPGFYCENLEITMPISPNQMLMLVHPKEGITDVIEHISIGDDFVHELNRRTRFHCREEFVTNSEVLNPMWFELGVLPDDCWEKQNPEFSEDEDE